MIIVFNILIKYCWARVNNLIIQTNLFVYCEIHCMHKTAGLTGNSNNAHPKCTIKKAAASAVSCRRSGLPTSLCNLLIAALWAPPISWRLKNPRGLILKLQLAFGPYKVMSLPRHNWQRGSSIFRGKTHVNELPCQELKYNLLNFLKVK